MQKDTADRADRKKSNRETSLFFIAAVLLTWLLWLPALLIQNFGVTLPISYDLFITIGSFVPSAALVLCAAAAAILYLHRNVMFSAPARPCAEETRDKSISERK